MHQARQVAATSTRSPEPAARTLVLDDSAEAPGPPTPLPRLGTADRIRDALRRWLEEDM
jgi:hypothetical protein